VSGEYGGAGGVLETSDGVAGWGAAVHEAAGAAWAPFGGELDGGAASVGAVVRGDKRNVTTLLAVPVASNDLVASNDPVEPDGPAAVVVFLRLAGAGFVTRRLRNFAGARTGSGAVVNWVAVVCLRRTGKGSTRRGGRTDGGGSSNGSGPREGGAASGGEALTMDVAAGEGSGIRDIDGGSWEN
jgi:hypothetical protein